MSTPPHGRDGQECEDCGPECAEYAGPPHRASEVVTGTEQRCPRSFHDGSGGRSTQASGKAESILLKNKSGPDQESDEIYLLSKTGENVKVRDDLMDIKVLREVDAEGLEQWYPVMKASLPAAGRRRRQGRSRRCDSPPPSPSRRDLHAAEFEAELAALAQPVRAVKVHKLRTRGTRSGSARPRSPTSRPEAARPKTIAVEGEDAAAVIAAVRELGLGDWLNTSYPKGLAALIDGDAGALRRDRLSARTRSSSTSASGAAGGKWRTVVDRAEVTRLGEGLEARGTDRARRPWTATTTAIAAMVAEAKTAGRAGDRGGRHGGPQDRLATAARSWRRSGQRAASPST